MWCSEEDASAFVCLPSPGIFLWSQWLFQSPSWRPFQWEWGAADTTQHPCSDSPQYLRRHLHPGPLLHLQWWYGGEASRFLWCRLALEVFTAVFSCSTWRGASGFLNPTALLCYITSVSGNHILRLAVSQSGISLKFLTFGKQISSLSSCNKNWEIKLCVVRWHAGLSRFPLGLCGRVGWAAASRWQIEHIWRCGKVQRFYLFTLGIIAHFSICSKSLFLLLFIAGVGKGSAGRSVPCCARYCKQ